MIFKFENLGLFTYIDINHNILIFIIKKSNIINIIFIF